MEVCGWSGSIYSIYIRGIKEVVGEIPAPATHAPAQKGDKLCKLRQMMTDRLAERKRQINWENNRKTDRKTDRMKKKQTNKDTMTETDRKVARSSVLTLKQRQRLFEQREVYLFHLPHRQSDGNCIWSTKRSHLLRIWSTKITKITTLRMGIQIKRIWSTERSTPYLVTQK